MTEMGQVWPVGRPRNNYFALIASAPVDALDRGVRQETVDLAAEHRRYRVDGRIASRG
jgi:hypothetical protein